ncbi:MAG: SDR family NAD(P)-dependent oxidoreductase [Acidimicrobiales bacterium]
MAGRLEGKVAYITGAGSGIARAAAVIFSREGAKVALAELDPALGKAAEADVRAGGGDAVFIQTDVTDDASSADSVAAAAAAFGRLDVLFACAGGSIKEDKAVTDVELWVWDHTMNLDLKGPILTCRHGIPHLQAAGGGSIICMSSVAATKGNSAGHIYSAAKGGVTALVRSLAGRYWKQNIRANAIAPGLILTGRVQERMHVDPALPMEEQMQTAAGRWGERYPFSVGRPEDIANVALFLASDESRMVNGATIPAEGGMTAY